MEEVTLPLSNMLEFFFTPVKCSIYHKFLINRFHTHLTSSNSIMLLFGLLSHIFIDSLCFSSIVLSCLYFFSACLLLRIATLISDLYYLLHLSLIRIFFSIEGQHFSSTSRASLLNSFVTQLTQG